MVSWKSKKSKTPYEYIALASLTCEIMWVSKLFFNLSIKDLVPVKIFCDNESSVKLALNPVFHEKWNILKWVDILFVTLSKGVSKVVYFILKNRLLYFYIIFNFKSTLILNL